MGETGGASAAGLASASTDDALCLPRAVPERSEAHYRLDLLPACERAARPSMRPLPAVHRSWRLGVCHGSGLQQPALCECRLGHRPQACPDLPGSGLAGVTGRLHTALLRGNVAHQDGRNLGQFLSLAHARVCGGHTELDHVQQLLGGLQPHSGTACQQHHPRSFGAGTLRELGEAQYSEDSPQRHNHPVTAGPRPSDPRGRGLKRLRWRL
mmetsp:Transcript_36714/g.75285  ORF Transcript_36714/g.75285 Transcript_36714/m.75285 type:complete len:211 (-) Transcript_36714:55-687(-)